MTELKTLKDFDISCGGYGCDGISYEELKQEAIKWINHLRGKLSKEIWKDDVKYVPWDSVLKMFKELEEIFNITEADLK